MIEKGQKYVAQEDQRGGRKAERYIEVITGEEADAQGRVDVLSVNVKLGTKRRIFIAGKRLRSAAYKLLPILLIAAFAACATAPIAPPPPPVPKVVSCNDKPQWFTYDTAGKPLAAVFVCFREDGVLTYQGVKLTPEQIASLTAPVPAVTHTHTSVAPKPPAKPNLIQRLRAGLKK